jgi:hypothetical protein
VTVIDKSKDTLLTVNNLTVGFKLLPALKKEWVITNVRLFGFHLNLTKKTSDSESNLEEIIKPLLKKSNNNTAINLSINSILLRRGNFRLDVESEAITKNVFNPDHIDITDISGRLSFNLFSRDSIHAAINKLSFNETSGFSVRKLTASFISNADSTVMEHFTLTLPHSTIRIPAANIGVGLAKTDSLARSWKEAPFTLIISKSELTPSDLKAFSPELQHFTGKANLQSHLSGTLNTLSINDIDIHYGNEIIVAGNADLRGLINKNEDLYVNARVKELRTKTGALLQIVNSLQKKENAATPKLLTNIDELQFTGEIYGYLNHLQTRGTFSSSIGSVLMDLMVGYNARTDKTLTLKGYVSSSDLQINQLFAEGNPYGTARFEADIDLTQPYRQKPFGTITAHINEAHYKGYNYENIFLSGNFKNNEYEGVMNIDDPNGKLELKGLFRNDRENSAFNFSADLTDFRPDRLNLTQRFKEPSVSLQVRAMFEGKNLDEFNGFIDINDIVFHTETDTLDINKLHIETNRQDPLAKQLNVSSNIINGYIKGDYSFSTLMPDLLTTAEKYLPTLVSEGRKTLKKKGEARNSFNFYFTVENTDNLTKILKIPVLLVNKGNIRGHYSSKYNSLETEIYVAALTMGKTSLENINFQMETVGEKLDMRLISSMMDKNNELNNIDLYTYAQNDSLKSTFNWTKDSKEKFEAKFDLSTLFIKDSINEKIQRLRTEISVPQTQFTIMDSLWTVEPAAITIADGDIRINNLLISKENQYLHLNGLISKNPQEKLFLELKDIEIGHIFDVLNISAVHFGGRATGKINARELTESRVIEGKLEVQDFAFNHATLGNLSLYSEWEEHEKGISLIGSIYNSDSTTWTDVSGYIFPVGKKQGISLYFDAKDLNIGFLNHYMDAFANKVSGRGFGKVHLYGSFKDVTLEGSTFVKDGSIGINILNTDYYFSDSVRMDANSITMRNTEVRDRDGNTGLLTLNFQHDFFRDLKYDLNLSANRMLVYDVTPRMKPELYGTVYVSGTSQIAGTEEFINIGANVRSEAGTSVGFNYMEQTGAENFDFIQFIDNNEDKTNFLSSRQPETQQSSSSMDYNLNFSIEATPDATFELILDPVSDDKIRGNGTGNMNVLYGNRNDLQMFGNFNILDGIYNFSLQQLIYKRFNIRDGSTVSFNGDPMNANLAIHAIYTLSANIQDLDQALVFETANTTIPVNCILNLDGPLQNPTISFDLELPQSKSELERQVRSFIDTEDMMTRQIIYLLALNKFYTPDYSRNNFRTNEFNAVASSALSAQLSNILSSISDKVQIGTNIRSRQDGIEDTEVEMMLSSRLLNNRLLFNGNFGYRDNFIQQNAFVGEFDLEYKLNRSGEISLKAYNHANDLYRYTTKSLTRQGVGIIFRKDFSRLSEIFLRKKKEE